MATTDDLEIIWAKPRSFVGSNHPGIRLNNLTTTQRDALTGSGAPKTGHVIFNTTTGQIEIYDGTNWVSHFAVDNIAVAGEITVDGDVGTGAATAGVINLNTSETTVVADDHLGRIEFAAPSEASGTDAVAMAAYIAAVAGDTFTATVNDTDLVFALGVSEAATEKFRMTSDVRLLFGGVSSSFPALKRSSAELQVRRADDSNYAQLIASSFVSQQNYAIANVGYLYGQSDGVMTLFNIANDSFGRLQLGGTTSSFPALKRSGSGIQVRVASDDADAALTAGRFISPRQTELTIATGAITVTGSYHDVDTESDGATDDLDTINGGVAGAILILRANNDGRTVVVKDGTGNIQCAGDMTLDNTQDTITLIFDGTLNAWLEIARAASGA